MEQRFHNFYLGASFPQDLQGLERSSRAIDTMLETFHVKSEKEQRRVKNKIKQEETVGEKKITLNRKHRDIQMKELTTQQRLVKTRYINMVKRTKANEISMKQRKK